MPSHIEREIKIMRDHLPELRKIAGWSAGKLSKMLDLSRPAMSALENKKVIMSQIHYLTLILLFSIECKKNEVLAYIINLLFYDTDDYLKKQSENDSIIADIADLGFKVSSKTKYKVAAIYGWILPEEVDFLSKLSDKILNLTTTDK